MKRTPDLSNKTKTELTSLARRKKIPVTSGMLKDDLVKTIKKGLKKLETKSKPKTVKAKTGKKKSTPKTAKKTAKKKAVKKITTRTSKAKTARKPKSATRKTTRRKSAPVSKKKAPKKQSSDKANVKQTPAKKKTARPSAKTAAVRPVQKQRPLKQGETPSELPERYGDHTLVVLARDPNWAYAYWDLNNTRVQELLSSTGHTPGEARWILRVYFAALHPVENKGHYFDVDIDLKTGSYYLDLSRPGARFIVEIGVFDASGLFRATAQSNPVILPLDHPSEITEGTSPSGNPSFSYGGSSPAGGASSPELKPGDSISGPGFSKPPSSGSE